MNKEINTVYVAPEVRTSQVIVSERICTGATVGLPPIDWKEEEEL